MYPVNIDLVFLPVLIVKLKQRKTIRGRFVCSDAK